MDQYQKKFKQTKANTLTHNPSTSYTLTPCRYFTPHKQHTKINSGQPTQQTENNGNFPCFFFKFFVKMILKLD